ncbi:MAG: hypothetical protein M1821_002861 [Bathelium mastoideum]|nr:MAG: hypothetical protein M1821_002861 [Bathelium mastoideum]KAI9694494.1 MAG: hypothetical protein M1822_000110 [Bathelium mastoideum]
MGGDGGNDTQQVTTNGSRVESFLLRNGTYDWSRDHAGVTFLQKAQAHGVPFITFFINAAPSQIADNGAACGWNLTAVKTPSFAEYIATVLSYWSSHGIDIKYISPMNEPDNNRADCGQEGMAVAPNLRAQAFSTIRSALSNSSAASKVNIIGDETSQITTQAFPEYPIWLASATPFLSNIAVHNYDYPDDQSLATYYDLVKNLTNDKPPPVKFTETCCSTNAGSGSSVFGAQYDPTMANALIVARYVWQFLTIVQAQSFDWWTAVTDLPCSPTVNASCATAINETSGYNSGLIYIDPNYNQTHDYNLYFTKRAFMLKHFSYFHRPGSVRYDVSQAQLPDGVHAFATKSANETSWSVLFINNQTSPFNLTLQSPGKRSVLERVVKTTPVDDWTTLQPLPRTVNGMTSFQLPAESLLSMQYRA